MNKGTREGNIHYVLVEFEDGLAETITVDTRAYSDLPEVGRHIFVMNSGQDIETNYEVVTGIPKGMNDPNSFFATVQFPLFLIIYSILSMVVNIISAVFGIIVGILIMKTVSKEGRLGLLSISMIPAMGMILGWLISCYSSSIFISSISGVLFAIGWIVFLAGPILAYQVKDKL
ncbi:MAG: hypothetical protein ACTSV2_00730 [Candidatus Thorarchaeota archaeon]